MKKSIKWYQECQANLFISIIQQDKIIKGMIKSLKEMKSRYNFREEQINKAIKQGKNSFDGERFMKKDALSGDDKK